MRDFMATHHDGWSFLFNENGDIEAIQHDDDLSDISTRHRFALHLLNMMAMQARKAEVWIDNRKLTDNFSPKSTEPEEIEEYAGMEWLDLPMVRFHIDTQESLLMSIADSEIDFFAGN